MVSKQKRINNLNGDSNEKEDFENEIKHVLNTCKDIITCTQDVRTDQKMNNKNTPINQRSSEITLEKVAIDMTNILKGLKTHIHSFNKNDSFSDVAPTLEETFKRIDSRNKKERCESNKNNISAGPKQQNNRNKNTHNKKKNANNNININPNFNTSKNVNNTENDMNNNINKSANSNINNNTKVKPAENNKIKANSTNNSVINSQKQSTLCARSNSLKGSANYSQGNTPSSRVSTPTGLNYLTGPSKTVYNPLGILKTEVERAIQHKKTFTVKGSFPAVRRALLKRGWVEKMHISYRDHVHDDLKRLQSFSVQELLELLRNKDIAENCKTLIKSKLLANNQVDLYWSYNYDPFKECPDKIKLTKINKFKRDLCSYTSKLGLCGANKKSLWFKFPGIAVLNHPRSYSLAKNGDTPEFIKDFNLTAAISLLKWVVQNNESRQCRILSPSGKIPLDVFDFATNECYKFIKKAQHEDIDCEILDALDHEYNEFLEYFYKTVHIGNHFKANGQVTENDLVRKANYILNKIKHYRPWLDMDGLMNMWILKPTNGSQGVGIHVCRTFQYILKTIKENPNRRYLIQKYIECPLLIYNTKFDIRQWFLISSAVPITIWMYKKCYLRFSSQTYNLRKLHESIHLTNNSIQSRYAKGTRDIALPVYNMWDLAQFKSYLSDIGYPKVFDTIIYPGMKHCITAAVIMCQDTLGRRKNCFELYGADFMITEDFTPWLLEINSNPALHASTPITSKMCPLVLEDVIKVVVDYEANMKADTGAFELIYKETLGPEMPNKDLRITGTPIPPNYFYTPSETALNRAGGNKSATSSIRKTPCLDAKNHVQEIGKEMRRTLENMLELLKKEKRKRLQKKTTGIATTSSCWPTETKESQTYYDLPSTIISETLITTQILETDNFDISDYELESTNCPNHTK